MKVYLLLLDGSWSAQLMTDEDYATGTELFDDAATPGEAVDRALKWATDRGFRLRNIDLTLELTR